MVFRVDVDKFLKENHGTNNTVSNRVITDIIGNCNKFTLTNGKRPYGVYISEELLRYINIFNSYQVKLDMVNLSKEDVPYGKLSAYDLYITSHLKGAVYFISESKTGIEVFLRNDKIKKILNGI